jgi:hypothetical protein
MPRVDGYSPVVATQIINIKKHKHMHPSKYVRTMIFLRHIKKFFVFKLHFFAKPIELLVKWIVPLKTKYVKLFSVVIGTVTLLTGAFLAHIPQTFVATWLWDGFTYGIHGMGVAPIIKIVFDAIDIEV